MILRYDSTAALRSAYIQAGSQVRHTGGDRPPNVSWYGNESEADTLRLSQSGDTRLVPAAEALLSRLDLDIRTPRKEWERSPAGSFCVVPDVLAGLPTPMRRQVISYEEVAPITILATTTSSAGIDAKTLEKRGTVILALVMALSRIRPVSLQQLTMLDGLDNGETIITSEINTAPLDLASACYVLTSAGFARRLTYGLARAKNRFTGGWPRNFDYGNSDGPYNTYLKRILTPDPTKCLIIGAAKLNDALLASPLEWIQEQIHRFTQEQEELVA